MILAPVTASNEAWHAIRGVQGAWRLALHTAGHDDADVTVVAAARRLAADAECELRDLWNAA